MVCTLFCRAVQLTYTLCLQVPLYPERHIQPSAAIQDPLSWKGDLLAIGIHSDALTVKGADNSAQTPCQLSSVALSEYRCMHTCIHMHANMLCCLFTMSHNSMILLQLISQAL